MVLFSHINDLKLYLQKNKATENKFTTKDLMLMFMITHYMTFIVNSLGEYTDIIDKELSSYIRLLIEDILSGDKYQFTDYSIRKLISFCDQTSKYFNVIHSHYLTLAIYEGSLTYKIYTMLHEHKRIFDFSYCWNVSEEMLRVLKINYDISVKCLNK